MYFKIFIFILGSYTHFFDIKNPYIPCQPLQRLILLILTKIYYQSIVKIVLLSITFLLGIKSCMIQVIRHYYIRKNTYKTKLKQTFIVLLRFYYITGRLEHLAHTQLVLFCQPQFNKKIELF